MERYQYAVPAGYRPTACTIPRKTRSRIRRRKRAIRRAKLICIAIMYLAALVIASFAVIMLFLAMFLI